MVKRKTYSKTIPFVTAGGSWESGFAKQKILLRMESLGRGKVTTEVAPENFPYRGGLGDILPVRGGGG